MGQALQDGYRERVHLVSKMPGLVGERKLGPWTAIWTSSLETASNPPTWTLYLLHGLSRDRWTQGARNENPRVGRKANGRRPFSTTSAFSFHDTYDAFTEIIDSYDNFVMAQVQYNLMDVDYQAGTQGVQYAASRGLAVVVMEPIRGGMLAGKLPTRIAEPVEFGVGATQTGRLGVALGDEPPGGFSGAQRE